MNKTEIHETIKGWERRAFELDGASMDTVLKSAGTSHTTLWRWKRGEYKPTAETIAKINAAFDAMEKSNDKA